MTIQHLPPKEKALELFNSMKGFKVKHSHSLKCAIKAVDEIIATDMLIDEDAYVETPSYLAYWVQVKSELLVLKKLAK